MAASNTKSSKLSSLVVGGISSVGKVGPPTATPKTTADAEFPSGVHIPVIRNKDNAKLLPTYTAALQRSADEYLAADELDNIQLELETLLSNVAQRYRVLKSEYENIDKDERRNERRTKLIMIGGENKQPTSPSAVNAATNGKRKREELLLVRKPKQTPGSTLKYSKIAKNSPAAMHTDDSMDNVPTGSQGIAGMNHGLARDRPMAKISVPKNDTPNRFWLSIEPYCMPVTNEDLRLLDNMLEQYSGPLVPPIPELGPHYSTVWAEQDLKEEQQASSNASNRLKPQNNAAASMLKKANSALDDCVTGPLTQRLVSALIEEQLLESPAEMTAAAVAESSNSSSENTHSSSQLNFRSLSMLRNCIDIEKRVKKELIDQGLLTVNDFPNHHEDEIQAEIKRVIAELSAVADYNSSALKRLRKTAEHEIKRLEIKHKLDAVDQDILEVYKRTMQNKAKRKPMMPEEQQEIYRLTAEQKALSDQLERIEASCMLYE